MCKRIFRFKLSLSSYCQNIKYKLPKISHIYKYRNFLSIIRFFLDQLLLHQKKFHDRNMWGMYFFIFCQLWAVNSSHDFQFLVWNICLCFKDREMGPLLVLVSPCFRENVNVTCKILPFLCSLDNFLPKNVIVFFFGNQISKWRSFEKGLFLVNFSIFLVTREKTRKIPSAHISLTYIYIFCSRYWLFLPSQFFKKFRIYQVWFLFGATPGVDSYLRHFGAINKKQKWWAKI